MIAATIKIENLDALRANFVKAPTLALKYLARATMASIFEVEKQAVDANFHFKTPRVFRTGQLSLSFAHGRSFENGGLRGSIGPTATAGASHFYYPGKVHQTNAFMPRIASAAEPKINEHFADAVDQIAADIANT